MHITFRLVLVLTIVLLAGCTAPTQAPKPGTETIATATPLPQTDIPAARSTAVPASDTPIATEQGKDSAASISEPTTVQDTPTVETAPASPPTDQGLPPAVVASVNGAHITQTAYELRVAQAQIYLFQQPGLDTTTPAGKEGIERLRRQVLDWMIDQVLIEQAAAVGVGGNAPIQITAEQVEQQVNSMRGNDIARFNQWLTSNGLTLDQLREQIRSDMITTVVRDQVTADVGRIVPQVHMRHILVSEESVAEKALAELRQGDGVDDNTFIAVARQYSEDTMTRNSGGDLGFVPHGIMPVPIEEIAFSMQAGQISDIIRTESGLHIIQVVEIDPNREVTPELWPVVQQIAFERWLQAQRDGSDLQVADITQP